MIKDFETFVYIIPFHNELGITFIWNVFLYSDLHKFSELKRQSFVRPENRTASHETETLVLPGRLVRFTSRKAEAKGGR